MELVVVILIIGILGAVGVGFGSKQISNARISTVTSNLKIIGNDIESAIVDLGFLDASDMADDTARTNYFQQWDKRYLTSPLDITTLTYSAVGTDYGSSYSGCVVTTKDYQDPWGQELRIYYLAPTSGEDYRILIASAGPNGKWTEDAAHGYVNDTDASGAEVDNYDDDVVLEMKPRG